MRGKFRSPLSVGAIKKITRIIFLILTIIIIGLEGFNPVIQPMPEENIIIKEMADNENNLVAETQRVIKSYEEIAYEIIRGDYGVGEVRKTALNELGYDEIAINEIQKIVRFILLEEKNNYEMLSEQTNIPEVALEVWNCMKKYGWSDIMCAGIMGNLMAEVGGQTFNLKYNLNEDSGYGLCQWTQGRRKLLLSMYGNSPTIEQQIEFMYKELVGEGAPRQISEKVYEELVNATSPEECALLFAHKFERCGAAFKARQKNARKAFEAFANIF